MICCFLFLLLDFSLFPKDTVVTLLLGSPVIRTSQSRWVSHMDEGVSEDVMKLELNYDYLEWILIGSKSCKC